MRLPRPIRRLYRNHETLAKVSGAVAFLIIVVVLYVAVFRSPQVTSLAGIPTPTPTPSPTATPTATALPGTPPVVSTPAPPFPLGPYQVKTQYNVDYGPVLNLTERLDLCSPVGASGLRPGLLIVHGGSFNDGDKIDYDGFCSTYASYGFLVAVPNYRLAPQYLWPTQLVDAQLALRWMRATASQHEMDPQRLCAMGDSAGGNLSVFLGVLTTIHAGDKADLYTDQSPQASCVVDEFGPVDMAKLTSVPGWVPIFPVLFGKLNEHNAILLRDASPVFDVTEQSAPMLIVQGTRDDTVLPSQSQELEAKLQSSGVPYSVINYPGSFQFEDLNSQQIEAIDLQVLSFLENQENP